MGNKKPRHFYGWVIRTKKKEKSLFGNRYQYFARRTSIKNPRYLTPMHLHVKIFVSKLAAETYYFSKSRFGHDVSKCHIRRLKFYIDGRGYLDYWKNREVLYR